MIVGNGVSVVPNSVVDSCARCERIKQIVAGIARHIDRVCRIRLLVVYIGNASAEIITPQDVRLIVRRIGHTRASESVGVSSRGIGELNGDRAIIIRCGKEL